MSKSDSKSSVVISAFVDTLYTLFLIDFVLKSAHLVTWSWWRVFSPLLIVGAGVGGFLLVGLIALGIEALASKAAR